jgi:hypothetical protein
MLQVFCQAFFQKSGRLLQTQCLKFFAKLFFKKAGGFCKPISPAPWAPLKNFLKKFLRISKTLNIWAVNATKNGLP